MDQLSTADDDEMDKSLDIKTASVVDSSTNFLHCASSLIVDESHNKANGHNSKTLPGVEDVNVFDSTDRENGLTPNIVPKEGNADQIIAVAIDKCDQISDIRSHTADGFDASETTEQVSVSNGSAVGKYLAGFSVNDIAEDDSISFIINEAEPNHSTSIQLDCAVLDANNELVSAIVDIPGSSSVEPVKTNEIYKLPETSHGQSCDDQTSHMSERNESEIPPAVQATDSAVDESHHLSITAEEMPCIVKDDQDTEEAVSLHENASQVLINHSVEEMNEMSLETSLIQGSKVPLITISSDSESEHLCSATKTVDRWYSSAAYTCHLCDIVFQEHEALNEHMILHRNNRLIETKVRDKTKTKPRYVSCDICQKQLPIQTLQHHMAIHKKKKLGKKESNSNIRMRRFGQDQRNRSPQAAADRNSIQKVDFDHLDNPHFIKQLLITGKIDDTIDNINNDVVPLNVFSDVENVVMNPARFIVRVDRMDANTVKRRIASPDISIEKCFEKKRRVLLSPSAINPNVKLDEIENIILDSSEDENVDSELNRDSKIEPSFQEDVPQHGKLTEDELFALLNDESPKVEEKSNETKRNSATSSFQPTVTTSSRVRSPLSCEDENDADMWNKYDAFDIAFHKVGLRRLALLRKRALETDGKVDRKYLLGPRFWRKTIYRAELQQVELEPTNVPAPIATALFDRNNRLDERETNDPTMLQVRAERKFQCMLNKLQLMGNPNGFNLRGPLFWRRTLRLAGVRTAADLKIFLEDAPTNLDGIQFVDANEIAHLRPKSRTKRVEPKKKAGLEFLHTPTTEHERTVVEPSSQDYSPARMIDLTSASRASTESLTTNSDVLYKSLMQRKENTIVPKLPMVVYKETQSRIVGHPKTSPAKLSKLATRSTTTVIDNALKPIEENKTVSNSIIQSDESVLVEGDYVLNVDGTGALQLVSTSTNGVDKNVLVGAEGVEANYMLVSDEAGNMQYMLNVPPEEELTNFQFFDGGGDVVNRNVEQQQLTYAIEFDGENYTAVPIIQSADTIRTVPSVEDEQIKPKINSMNLIGRELSDFINLDVTSLMKSGQTDLSAS